MTRHATIHFGSKGTEGDQEMPDGHEKRRRSQKRNEAYCSVASASSLINTTNYYWAGNQVMVTDAVQKGEREGKITSADYCLLWLAYLSRSCILATKYY